METSANQHNGNFVKELEDELLNCTSNYKDHNFEMDEVVEQTEEAHGSLDVEVNVTECTNSGGQGLCEMEYLDSTECSSSFDDIDSELENGATVESNVLSVSHDDATSAHTFDGYVELYRTRKKKLTSHWRTFIQPVMWRCKWIELQIKKFQSQAQIYDRELAEHSQHKQFQSENFKLEGAAVKSLPLSCNNIRVKVMRRKKRRTDSALDVAAYMSHHCLFSYYENRKSFGEGAVRDNDPRNSVKPAEEVQISDEFEFSDEIFPLESEDGGKSLKQILEKIELLQSQVGKLKSRVDKIIREDAGEFSFTSNLSLLMPCNALIDSHQNIASASADDKEPVGTYIASQLLSQYNNSNVRMPECAVSRQGEAGPSVIESTDQPHLAIECLKAEDDVLIDNLSVKEEMNSFDELKVQPVHNSEVPKDGLGSTGSPLLAEPDLPTDDLPPPKIRSISKLTAPKSKRKRVRRKGKGRRSRRSSG